MKYTLLLMGLIGLYGFFASLRILLRDRKRSLVPTEGTVVELERSKDAEGFVSFTPIYEYHFRANAIGASIGSARRNTARECL